MESCPPALSPYHRCSPLGSPSPASIEACVSRRGFSALVLRLWFPEGSFLSSCPHLPLHHTLLDSTEHEHFTSANPDKFRDSRVLTPVGYCRVVQTRPSTCPLYHLTSPWCYGFAGVSPSGPFRYQVPSPSYWKSKHRKDFDSAESL
jgi:hypothetical protein